MKNAVAWSVLIVCTCAVAAFGQNKVVFDNQSGEPALVKLIGPTPKEVEVPNGAKVGADAAAGRYVIKVRYGSPGKYHYAKGQEFAVTETATARSETTITLHKVVAGNYETEAISQAEFGEGARAQLPQTTTPPAVSTAKSATNVVNGVDDVWRWLQTEGGFTNVFKWHGPPSMPQFSAKIIKPIDLSKMEQRFGAPNAKQQATLESARDFPNDGPLGSVAGDEVVSYGRVKLLVKGGTVIQALIFESEQK